LNWTGASASRGIARPWPDTMSVIAKEAHILTLIIMIEVEPRHTS
jgi:hypothetical protein